MDGRSFPLRLLAYPRSGLIVCGAPSCIQGLLLLQEDRGLIQLPAKRGHKRLPGQSSAASFWGLAGTGGT